MTNEPPCLLDVNVLVALFDPGHVHHDVAHDWFADTGRAAWATCAITENGFLRVLSHPRSPVAADYQTLLVGLRSFCASEGHVFWSERVLELDAINPQVAARLARALDRWKKLAEPYRSAAREAVARVAAKADLSNDVREVVTRALAE